MKANSPIEIFLAIVLLLTVILLLSLALIPRKLPAIWVLSIAAKAVPDADLTNTAPPLPRTVPKTLVVCVPLFMMIEFPMTSVPPIDGSKSIP